MTTLARIGLGLVVLVAAAIAEAVLKRGRSRPLSNMAPDRYKGGEIKPQLGMEATDVKAVNATIRHINRAAQTHGALTLGTKGLRGKRWVDK